MYSLPAGCCSGRQALSAKEDAACALRKETAACLGVTGKGRTEPGS